MYTRGKTILWALSISFIFVLATQEAQAYELATDIADHYIKSFASEGKQEEKFAKEEKSTRSTPARLDEKQKREVAFNSIFTKSKDYALIQRKMAPILNQYVWGDLKLFYGTTSTPAYHLMNRINRTHTLLGEGALATMLVTPSSNVEELKERQHIIQTLLAHPALVVQLKDSLQTYQEAEKGLLSFWTPNDPLYTKEYQSYMNRTFYRRSPQGNKSASLLEWDKRLHLDFWTILYSPLLLPSRGWLVNTILSRVLLPSEVAQTVAPLTLKGYFLNRIPYYPTYRLLCKDYRFGPYSRSFLMNNPSYKDPGNEVFLLDILSTTLNDLEYTIGLKGSINSYQVYSHILSNLALRMADVQAFVLAAAEVREKFATMPELEELYGPRLASIRKLLAQAQEDTELGRLVHYLQTLPYNSWSYFFNNAGKLLASHKLFTEYKDEFADAMYALGELDALLSVTTLVEESRNNGADHTYTFTKYLDRNQKSKPYVKLEDMWNPFLEAKVAVGNSVEMDAEKGVRNIILTGPNAGGKSTFLTGVTTSLLLSQTFGIAPAKEAVITPFDKINTYIDIADDVAAGKSLFMAEVDRAQEHLKILARLKPDEFSFTGFDEPFSGTNPTEGAAAEYSILESMAEYTNTLNIVATHYPIVMLLEKNASNKGFRNYKVYIKHEKGQKNIGYTYKVIPGRSTQAIAIDILEEQGYDTKLLKRAREIIKHPERYRSKF